MYIEQTLGELKGLLTPVIAIVATYIAYQQWKTNQQKLKLEIYNRRLHIYEEVKTILSIIARDTNKVSADNLLKFRISVSEADFLFGPEIVDYINEIYQRGLNVWQWNNECKKDARIKSEDHRNVLHNELLWLLKQFEPAKEKFRKYLDLYK